MESSRFYILGTLTHHKKINDPFSERFSVLTPLKAFSVEFGTRD